MRVETELCVRPYALIGHADGVPYGELGETALVVPGPWSAATAMTPEGCQSLVMKMTRSCPFESEPHPELDGVLFPDSDAARRAQYEAGVLVYLAYLDGAAYGRAAQMAGASRLARRR